MAPGSGYKQGNVERGMWGGGGAGEWGENERKGGGGKRGRGGEGGAGEGSEAWGGCDQLPRYAENTFYFLLQRTHSI